jgi:hypothetical protein
LALITCSAYASLLTQDRDLKRSCSSTGFSSFHT